MVSCVLADLTIPTVVCPRLASQLNYSSQQTVKVGLSLKATGDLFSPLGSSGLALKELQLCQATVLSGCIEFWRHSCWFLWFWHWPIAVIKLSRGKHRRWATKGKECAKYGSLQKDFPEIISLSPQRRYVHIFSSISACMSKTNTFEPLHDQDSVSKPHMDHTRLKWLPLSFCMGVIISRRWRKRQRMPSWDCVSRCISLSRLLEKNPIWLETGLIFSCNWSWENTYKTPPCQPKGAILLITCPREAKLTQGLHLAGALGSSVLKWTNFPFSLLHEPLAAFQSVWWQLCTPRKIDFRLHCDTPAGGLAQQFPAPVGGGFDYMHSGKQIWPSPTPSLFSYAFLCIPWCAPIVRDYM